MGKNVETKITITCDICGAEAKEYNAWFRIVSHGWDNIYGQHEEKEYVILSDWLQNAVIDWDAKNAREASQNGVCLCDKHFQPLEDLMIKFITKWNKQHAKEHNAELANKPPKPKAIKEDKGK